MDGCTEAEKKILFSEYSPKSDIICHQIWSIGSYLCLNIRAPKTCPFLLCSMFLPNCSESKGGKNYPIGGAPGRGVTGFNCIKCDSRYVE